MTGRDWDQHYADGNLPWDTNEPDPQLVRLVEAGVVLPGATLEIGCGTGTNAIWLARHGFVVRAVDVSPRAIAQARAKCEQADVDVELSVHDFLADDVPEAAFDFVFDRGVFHVFDDDGDRARFAERVARALGPGGQWVSLLGSTEGPPRDHGPPRRSAREILEAVEPVLAIVSLQATMFDADLPTPARAWTLRARVRDVPAQPSTGRG